MTGTRTAARGLTRLLSNLLSDYGMLLVLLLLGVYYSAATWTEQDPQGGEGAARLVAEVRGRFPAGARVLVAAGGGPEDVEFAEALTRGLAAAGFRPVATVTGEPREARRALERLAAGPESLDVIAGNRASAAWLLFSRERLQADFPSLAGAAVVF